MPIIDPNFRYATQTWETDGVETDYEIAFSGGYIRQEDVLAFSVVVDPETGLLSDQQLHSLEFLVEGTDGDGWKTATVRVSPVPDEGRRLVIFRSTQKTESLLDYTDGSVVTEKNLDLANQQAILGIAEIVDGLAEASLQARTSLSVATDLNKIIREIYEEVLELLASGGIVSVEPRVWSGVGNGSDTDFPIEGAEIGDSGFYDTYVAGVGLEPSEDYTIVLGETPLDSSVRFATPVPDGVRWFTVLRGFAKPYTGPQPIVSLRMNIIDTNSSLYFIGKDSEFALIRSNSPTTAEFRVNEIPAGGDETSKLGDGSYVSIAQRSSAQVVLKPDTENVNLIVPAGYLPRTRALNSVISITCEFGDGNSWIVSGDLAQE
jgi:hypothetical protein